MKTISEIVGILFKIALVAFAVVTFIVLLSRLFLWNLTGCSPIAFFTATPAPGFVIEENGNGYYRSVMVDSEGYVTSTSPVTTKSLAAESSWIQFKLIKEREEEEKLQNSNWRTSL